MSMTADPTMVDLVVLPDQDDPAVPEARSPEAPPAPSAQPTPPDLDGLGEPAPGEDPRVAGPAAAIPFPLRRLVRGRYRSSGGGFELELRVDVDGAGATGRVSGDFFAVAGGTTTFFGSFVVSAPVVTTTASRVHIEGAGTYTWAAGAPYLRIDVPRVPILAAPGSATVQFGTPQTANGASYLCRFASAAFRTLQWELDSVAGTVPFVSYDTASLPQPAGSTNRVLTIPGAYGEAGIEMQVSGAANVIPTSAAGADAKWSDAELHAAMVNNFSLFQDVPQWRVWTLVATSYADLDGVRGIMFDGKDGHQRQGCAVFHDAIKGTDAATQRSQLRTYVHELGHCFNLFHSWQKNLATPPQPLGENGGLGDLSWMNYDWRYAPAPPAPGGAPAYWTNFAFRFTAAELVHLRHGFYRDVVMGANAFGQGAADVDPDLFDAPVVDGSGLSLALRARDAFAFGEPVVVELKLATTDSRGRSVTPRLHPKDDLVSIAIQQPSGRTVAYRPLLRRCVDAAAPARLTPSRAVYDSAYIGAGRDGMYFDSPGVYRLRARYTAPDGSSVVSPTLTVRVRPPMSDEDQRVGELLSGEQQGILFQVLGSESSTMSAGNDALDEVVAEHGSHPLATYARLARGFHARRPFKELTGDKELIVLPARASESAALLGAVVQASTSADTAGAALDNVSLNQAMRALAEAEAAAGNRRRATQVLDRMVPTFRDRGVAEPVLATIAAQADATRSDLSGQGS